MKLFGDSEVAELVLKLVEKGQLFFDYEEKQCCRKMNIWELLQQGSDDYDGLKDETKKVYQHLCDLEETHKNYLEIRNEYVILKINEFAQDLKNNIFKGKIDLEDLIHVLNKLDVDREKARYIVGGSFNALDTAKKEYEAYKLAERVQPYETIRVMSYHFRYALNGDNIMRVFEDQLDNNVKINILMIHPCSKFVRLRRTRIDIIDATNNLLQVANKKIDETKSKYLEVRYHGYIPDDTHSITNGSGNNSTSNFSEEFLFRGQIFGDRALVMYPHPSIHSREGILGDPYYSTWGAQNVYILENQKNGYILNMIELYQNYFDNIWSNKSITIGQFLQDARIKSKCESIKEGPLCKLENTYNLYVNRNGCSNFNKKC